MNRDTSLYLDGVRFLAALVVLVGHVEWTFAPGLVPFVKDFHLATLAVGIFFVLSGYVIGCTVDQKETDARSYFLNRAARIYSVVVPVLLLTLLLDTCGRWLAPNQYGSNFSAESVRLLVSLTFVNQAWQWNLPAGTDVPFWSLGYEVPYYVAFGLWFFGRTLWWRLMAIALMMAGGPRIAILFGLWLLGFGCYQLTRQVTLTRVQGRALLLLSSLFLAMAPYVSTQFSLNSPFGGGIVGFTQFFVAGIPFAGTIVGFAFAKIPFTHCSRPIRWLAGTTFTLYLLHYPLGYLLRVVLPSTWPLGTRWIVILSVVLLSAFLVAEFTERRKQGWRDALTWLEYFLRHRARWHGPGFRRHLAAMGSAAKGVAGRS